MKSHLRVPGEEIYKLMEKWGRDHLYEPEEIIEYADCLWISLEKYESQLKQEEKGFQLIAEKNIKKYKNRLKRYINVTSSQIEALESALIETKLNYRRELDRISMHSADIESKLMSLVKTDQYIDGIVKKVEHGYSLKNLTEARLIIAELVGCVKSKHSEMQNLKQQFTIMSASNMAKEKKVYLLEKN